MDIHKLAKDLIINETAPLISKHTIQINSSIENVWKNLTDFENWMNWNNDIESVSIFGEFSEDQKFIWKSGGSTINSKIAKINKPNVFAWSGNVLWIKAIHIWKLTKVENKVEVEVLESMEGFLSTFLVGQKKLDLILMNWLKSLKKVCEK